MSMSKFHTIEETEKLLQCEPNTLIKLAAQGRFPVFIAANNWYAHVICKLRPNNDGAFDNGLPKEEISKGGWVRHTPLDQAIQLNDIFLQLKASSLTAYQLNKTTNIECFEMEEDAYRPEEYLSEYKLCDPSNFSKSYVINLEDYKLVVMDYCLPKIKTLVWNESIKNEAELSASERKKLLKVIGSLVMKITNSHINFKNNGKPNAHQISEKVIEMFDDINELEGKLILKTSGLSSSNLRAVIKNGIDELCK